MIRRYRVLGCGVVVAFAGCLAAGCVDTQTVKDQTSSWTARLTDGPSPAAEYELTQSERQMREQSRNFDKTIWQGVLIGAAGGTIWGLLRGDDTEGILKKAALGGLAGGLAGAYVAHKQREYSDREDQLDSMIADVRQSNRQTEAFLVSVREVVAEDRRRLASVDARYRQGAITQSELEAERARVADNRKVITDSIDGAKEKYAMFEGAKEEYEAQNPQADTEEFGQELETFNEHIETLDSLAEDLAVA